MKISTRLFPILICSACLLTTTAINANAGGGRHGHGDGGHASPPTYTGNGHGGFWHHHNDGLKINPNTSGAAKRPKSAGQPTGPVVRDHGAKNTKTTTTTSCSRGPHSKCATVRDHTSGPQGDWHTPPHGSSGPAGGPNSRKPPPL